MYVMPILFDKHQIAVYCLIKQFDNNKNLYGGVS